MDRIHPCISHIFTPKLSSKRRGASLPGKSLSVSIGPWYQMFGAKVGVGLTRGYVKHVGTSNTWVRQTRGYVKHVGTSNTWVRRTHGYVKHMYGYVKHVGTSNTWVCQTRGYVKHVGTSNTWVCQTRGYVKHVGMSNTQMCDSVYRVHPGERRTFLPRIFLKSIGGSCHHCVSMGPQCQKTKVTVNVGLVHG